MTPTDPERQALQMATAEVFSGPAGALVLEYLRSITQKMSITPPFDISQIAHLEGQRYLFGTIESLILSGTRLKQGASHAPQAISSDDRLNPRTRARSKRRS